jgi:hypothetical protein
MIASLDESGVRTPGSGKNSCLVPLRRLARAFLKLIGIPAPGVHRLCVIPIQRPPRQGE